MGLLDGLLGRPAPAVPDLDRLFALPGAAAALEAATGLVPTGGGAVCHRLVEGGPFGAFGRAQREVTRLLGHPAAAGGPCEAGTSGGPHGWVWVHVAHPPGALGRLVGDLHLVNATLDAAGYGPYLLCTVVGFRRDGSARPLLLVHPHGRGTFYPFAPSPGEARHRDGALEARVRDALSGELPIEQDTARRFPVWDAPGL
ncbi:hypothetical protein AGRA3207_006718 [Actinomadura graeca]|uniref:Uncharacterized protein n=1 Tax=Actinomadura graeca TaxID=2750812 RepID=A0ABX8R312_9ACTN|nr:hypothetical protein [Actinomadura graeca]QXJ25248.1 hypothetical protein AGRA3207_006718 [Actinomadura graeca]